MPGPAAAHVDAAAGIRRSDHRRAPGLALGIGPVADQKALGRRFRLAHRRPRRGRARRRCLAARAEVRRAAGDDDPANRLAAARAGLALARVDQELVLHRAALTAGVAVVVDRRAAMRKAGLERIDDPVAQLLGVLEAHRAGGRERVQVGAEERLVGVDVADPRDLGLVEQKRLQRCPPAGRELEQQLRRQVAAQRLDPEPGGEVGVELGLRQDDGVAKAPWVGEPELRAVIEHQPGAQVAGVGVRLVQARAAEPVARHQVADRVRSGRPQQQVAGHPQMHDQRDAVVEHDDQVLAAPPDRRDPPALQRPLDRGRQLRPRPALVEDLGALDRPPDGLGLELAADGFDLGELRHPSMIAAIHPRCGSSRQSTRTCPASCPRRVVRIWLAAQRQTEARRQQWPSPTRRS